jgi:hypothetical protein
MHTSRQDDFILSLEWDRLDGRTGRLSSGVRDQQTATRGKQRTRKKPRAEKGERDRKTVENILEVPGDTMLMIFDGADDQEGVCRGAECKKQTGLRLFY